MFKPARSAELAVPAEVSYSHQQDPRAGSLTSLSAREVQDIFGRLEGMLNSLTRVCGSDEYPNLTRSAHETRMIAPFQGIKSEWFAIDHSNLNPEDEGFLYDALTIWLPEIVCQYRERATRNGVRVTMESSVVSDIPRLNGPKFENVLRSYHADLVSLRDRQWRAGYNKPVQKKALAVPSLKHHDVQLHSALAELHRLWGEANSKILSTEDRFFVDEVAARYFPDAWRMLQSFSQGDVEMKSEAKDIFLEQVSLMCRRLEKLVRVTQQGSLDEMRAQASFLREVTA